MIPGTINIYIQQLFCRENNKSVTAACPLDYSFALNPLKARERVLYTGTYSNLENPPTTLFHVRYGDVVLLATNRATSAVAVSYKKRRS